MTSNNMPPDVEKRIRALPGNNTCVDCSNVNPQWASVSYGTLVCLECSGQHRSLGVHLSFVRSVQMDSWTEKQIRAMETSGGNDGFVSFMQSRGIQKSMPIATKYNSKQAAYYKERLSRRLDGKTEPPPDPGNYDPVSGGDALGAEALPGETPEQYNERQQRLREAARERMRAKFGQGGMSGVGSEPASRGGGDFDFSDFMGGVVGSTAGVLGGAASGALSFVRNNVIENENLPGRLRDTVGGVTETATGAWSSLRKTVADGELIESLKRNATLEDGSMAKQGLGWTVGTVSNIWEKGNETIGNLLTEEPQGASPGMRPPKSSGSGGSSSKAAAKAVSSFDDDDWGEDVAEAEPPPPPAPSKKDMERMAKELGMNLGGAKSNGAVASSPAPAAPAAPAAPVAPKPTITAPSPSKAKSPAAAPAGDDFFAEFGV
mmetsp:Transcript_110410/g.235819  ORF Transcript_110410/g.235819 Transcript_110410/m.235819 type:complete len:433 (+) Transcript_110410:118-1416(+)